MNSLSSNDENKNDQGVDFGVEEATQQDGEIQNTNVMHGSQTPQQQNVQATQQAEEDEDAEKDAESKMGGCWGWWHGRSI